MSKKTSGAGQATPKQPPLQDAVKDSAHQIWLAGLGAFQKAQQEGNKMFDLLVQEGVAMQRKAQESTTEKLSQATQKVSEMAEELGNRASDHWDRFEHLFELRVSRALHRLGMPTTREVQALHERIAELEKQVPAKPAARPRTSASAKARPTAAKKKAPSRPRTSAARKKTG